MYRLLDAFESLFNGKKYNHRDSSLGDGVAKQLIEDLFDLDKSDCLKTRIERGERVANSKNKTIGKKARRGDATFGEIVPGSEPTFKEGNTVAQGPVATVEIGAEVKILAKAMIKQIDRVFGDLNKQVVEFKKRGGKPICIGIVGINRAKVYTSYEGIREYLTDGKKYKHPIEEAAEAELRLYSLAAQQFDEFIVLRFDASNVSPYPFTWIDEGATRLEYAAALTRVVREYESRFC